MRKIILVFLTFLSLAPMLSGCFYYPYGYGGYYRYDRYDRGYYRDYDDQRDGYRRYR